MLFAKMATTANEVIPTKAADAHYVIHHKAGFRRRHYVGKACSFWAGWNPGDLRLRGDFRRYVCDTLATQAQKSARNVRIVEGMTVSGEQLRNLSAQGVFHVLHVIR